MCYNNTMEQINKKHAVRARIAHQLWTIAAISLCGAAFTLGSDVRLFLPQRSEFLRTFFILCAPLILSFFISVGMLFGWFIKDLLTPHRALTLIQTVSGASALLAIFDLGMRVVRHSPWMLRAPALLVQDVVIITVFILWGAVSHIANSAKNARLGAL